MLESIRKAASIPEISLQGLLTAGILVSFFWLLLQNQIHPIVIYLLQLYLSL